MKRNCETSSRSHNRYAELHTLVHAVIEQWRDAYGLPPIAASQLDEDGDAVPQRVLLPGSVALNFKIDVEKITARVLNNRPELQAAWFAIAQGKPVNASEEQRLVQLLGPAYRPLSPASYFRPRRIGSASSRRRALHKYRHVD